MVISHLFCVMRLQGAFLFESKKGTIMKLEGKKLEMSQIFLEDGTVVPVTSILVEGELVSDIVGKMITVVGTSKGAGFAGVIKRFHFKGGPKTHGQSDRHRAPGASGQTTTPGRVYKGKRRAGRHGNKKVTLKGLKIMEVDNASKKIKVSGPIPGARNSKVLVEVIES